MLEDKVPWCRDGTSSDLEQGSKAGRTKTAQPLPLKSRTSVPLPTDQQVLLSLSVKAHQRTP